MNKNTDRNKQIIAAKDTGLTYAQIANLFGITRQRAHQIYQQEMKKKKVEEVVKKVLNKMKEK